MLYKFFSLLLFVIVFLNGQVFAEPLAIKKDGPIQHAKLKNGLEVYVIPNHRIPALLHAVIYKVGAMDDPMGKAGLAHYFEHLMFEAMGKFKDFRATVSSIGAEHGAFTTKEYTWYYELVLKKDLPLAMEVEADRMASFNVSQDKIDREKNIVLEEIKREFNNQPGALLWEEMDNAFYRTGYGKPLGGWETGIDSFNYNDIKRFHDNYYHPGNAILLIIGDVKFAEVLKLAKEKYGAIKSKAVIRHYPNQEPVHNANMRLTVSSAQVKDPVLYVRYKVPIFKCMQEAFAVNLAVELLGRGKSSKLYKDLVLDKDIAVSIDPCYSGLTFTDGFIDIAVIPKSGVDLDIIEKELVNSINDFIHQGITGKELENAKCKYKAAQLDTLANLKKIAAFYAKNLALNIPFEDIDISYSQVDNVTLEDIHAKICTVFTTHKLVGRLLPQEDNSHENK